MKAKLNLTIDRALIPSSKKYARENGISVSELVEQLLRTATEQTSPSFSSKWRGRFKPAPKNDTRYRALADRFLK